QITSKHRDGCEHCSGRQKNKRVDAADLVEQARKSFTGQKRQSETNTNSYCGDDQTFAKDHSPGITRLGAEGETNPDFASPAHDGVGAETIQSNGGKEQRGRSKDGKEARRHADDPQVEAALQVCTQRLDGEERQAGLHVEDGATNGVEKTGVLAQGSYVEGHITLVFSPEGNIDVGLKALAERVFLHIGDDTNDLSPDLLAVAIKRIEEDLLPNGVAIGPEVLRGHFVENNDVMGVRAFGITAAELTALQ